MFLNNCFSNLSVIFNYLISDIIKRQRSFKIGFFSIYLVVFFITMLLNFISLSSTIFIRICEESVGEADFTFTPFLTKRDTNKALSTFDAVYNTASNQSSSIFDVQFINFEEIYEKSKHLQFLKGVSPRWMLRGNVTAKGSNGKLWNEANIFILDSELENRIGMGRSLNWKQIGVHECYISSSLYKSLKIKPGENDVVSWDVKLSSLLNILGIDNQSSLFESIIREHVFAEGEDMNKIFNYTSLSQKEIIISLFKALNIEVIPVKISKFRLMNTWSVAGFVSNQPLIDINKLSSSSSSVLNSIVNELNKTVSLNQINDDIPLSLNLSELISPINDDDINDILSFQLDLKIKEVVKQTSGKWPSASGNVLAFDSKSINAYLKENIHRILHLLAEKTEYDVIIEALEELSDEILSTFKLNHYALIVNGIIKNKWETYSQTHNHQRVFLAQQTTAIMNSIGIDYPWTITTPLFTMMEEMEISKVFLENIFLSVLIFLWLLSVLLIYSLMLGNVDERAYEFGWLRSLGFKKDNLAGIIIAQGFIFSIPGVLLGWLSSYIVNNFIAFWLNRYSGWVIPFFDNSSIIWGIALGVSIPLVSSYLPIKQSLNANLKETLTIFNKNIGDWIVSIVKLENYGLSPTSVIASIVIISIGFSAYYLAPLSFLLMDPSIFLFIMTMILMLMLFGLIVLVQVVIPMLQKGILRVIMFISIYDNKLRFVVEKNWDGHGKRNTKVSIMFMIAIGFIIFAGCTLNLIVSFVENISKASIGGDCAFWRMWNTKDLATLNQNKFIQYWEKMKGEFPSLIENYTFRSYDLKSILKRKTYFGALNGSPSQTRPIVSVDIDYIKSGYQDLYKVSDYDKELNYTMSPRSTAPDLVSMWYLNPNVEAILSESSGINYPISINETKFKIDTQLRVIIAEGIKKAIGVDVDNPGMLWIDNDYEQKVPCKVVGIAGKLPGDLTVSSYSTLALLSPAYISNEQMKIILDDQIKLFPYVERNLRKSGAMNYTVDHIPKQGLIVKFGDDCDETLKDMVYYEWKNWANLDNAEAFYLSDIIETARNIGMILEYVFLVWGLIAWVLSFFLLWISFYSSIKENICEYGIMRAIGVTRNQMTRVFLYEAGSIILSSIITGTGIGVVISITLILQFDVFAELPFVFDFPWKLYWLLVGSGMVLGMWGAFYPTFEVNKLSLIKIMKGLSE